MAIVIYFVYAEKCKHKKLCYVVLCYVNDKKTVLCYVTLCTWQQKAVLKLCYVMLHYVHDNKSCFMLCHILYMSSRLMIPIGQIVFLDSGEALD